MDSPFALNPSLPPKSKKKPSILEAVCVVKVNELLCKSYALTIVDGIVQEAKELTRAEDLPSVSIGLAQRALWAQMRVNRDVPA